MVLSSNVAGDSNDENNFPHILSLANAQVSRRCKAFARSSSATELPLIKNVLKSLAKGVVIILRLSEEMSAADAAIKKKIYYQ